MALPPVGDRLAARPQLVAPRIFFSDQSTARGKLPFGLSRQTLAGPCRISGGIMPRDLTHRLVRVSLCLGAVRVSPACAVDVLPFARLHVEDARPTEFLRIGLIV